MKPEGFALRATRDGAHRLFEVFSIDGGGAMYGGLELAEQIRTQGVDGVVDIDRNAYMTMRGTKFNIPLDLRTPSYSDMSDSAQENIATVWDFDFWRAYLDKLARDRYNFVSLWNLHPFPSMVRVAEYPRRCAQRRLAIEVPVRRGLFDAHHRHRDARDARQQGSRQAAQHRAEDRILAPRDAIREGSQHRFLHRHVEHLHVRGRRQVRHHRCNRQPENPRLLPCQRTRDVPHLSAAGGDRPHHRREHGRNLGASRHSRPRRTGCSPPTARACWTRQEQSPRAGSASYIASTRRAPRTSPPLSSPS